jgi:hypothetical protein
MIIGVKARLMGIDIMVVIIAIMVDKHSQKRGVAQKTFSFGGVL